MRYTGRLIATAALLVAACPLAHAGASVSYQTSADWQSEFTGQITIKNTGATTLQNWALDFDFAPTITSMWDAQVSKHQGSHYVIVSAGWNDTIAPGASVVFGFSGSPGNVSAGPQNMQFSAVEVALNSTPAAVAISVAENSAFNGKFTAAMAVTNSGASPLSDWTLDFHCDQQIGAISGANWATTAAGYEVKGTAIPAGGQISLTLTGAGSLSWNSFSACTFNGASCQIVLSSVAAQSSSPSIAIQGVDTDSAALQIAVGLGVSTYGLSLSSAAAGNYTVNVSNPDAVSASILDGGTLRLVGLSEGRSAIRIQDSITGATRFIGVRVDGARAALPRLPQYLALGSVSEDTTSDLGFWQSFQPGPKNRRIDIRYIYLNGGPVNGWNTWGSGPGSRATTYIRNSRMLGIIPFFVFYNIPDSSEGYSTDLQHAQDASYMQAYFKNLKLALDIINQESPDDVVGIILEPDFIGYLAQNANQPANGIRAATNAAYSAGVLKTGADPSFPDTVRGLVEAINFTISKYSPQVVFGWQMNLWASPPGGFTTSIPATGLMHKTDVSGVAAGRPLIYNEAAAITSYYLDAGIASNGAGFVSVDKYGLDATGFQASAAQDPGNSVWFWNNDQWQNYLTFVRAMHQTSGLPVVLWQLPVGHVNSSLRPDPYSTTGLFPDLADSNRALEDSSATFFFGDSFATSGARYTFFSKNDGSDPKVRADGKTIVWGEHFSDAAASGVIAALFGAGVGASTTNLGDPPTDAYWWITAAEAHYNERAGSRTAPPRRR